MTKVHWGLFAFTFRSFRLFLFDVRCCASISPVGCVRVSDVGFSFFSSLMLGVAL